MILVCPHLGHREQAHRLVSSRQEKSVRGAPCRSLHRQEQSWAFTDKHVWLSRRWSELGTRDLPGHDWNRVCAGQSIAVHLLPIRETTPCAGARRRLRTPRLHHQCQTFFFFFSKLQEVWVVTNRGIFGLPVYHDCVQSIRVLGRIVERTADGITWEADPRHAELIRNSYGVTGSSVATNVIRDKVDDIEG